MWAHYADGHKGVAIGVDIDPAMYTVHPIQYDGLHRVGRHNYHAGSAVDILSRKLDFWRYEAEERVFTENKLYVRVKVRQIICGSRMSHRDKGFITHLVKKINPEIDIIDARTNSAYV